MCKLHWLLTNASQAITVRQTRIIYKGCSAPTATMTSNATYGVKSGHLLKEKTFQYDENLPSLPVPSLDSTLHKYLDSVKPLVTDEEFAETKKIVDEFGRGIGQKLHQRLLEKSKREKNWVEKWWEEYAYLQSRGPLAAVGNMVGPLFAIKDIWPPWQGTQLERTSVFLWIALGYFQDARRQKLPVMKSSSGDQVFAMNQIRSLFCTSRIPGESTDQFVRNFKTEDEGPCPDYIIVMCNGHIFKMDKLFDEDGERVGTLEILRRLTLIKEKSVSPGQGIGILTADDRISWSKTYKYMHSVDPANGRNFDIINNAVFVACLDTENPTNISELMWQSMVGPNARDRWYDKSYNVICFQNGTFGSTGDHGPLDGIVVAMYSYWCHMQIKSLETRFPGNNSKLVTQYDPEELLFITDEQVNVAMEHATQTYERLASNIDIICSDIGGYGKKFVKSQKFHPDAFFQLAIQLTYYTMYKTCVPCYETATTRQFYHGRTETVRGTSQEVVDWCKAMLDSSKTKSERYSLMKEAHGKYLYLMEEAREGRGIDRHLLGLYILALESGEELPAIFTHPSYTKSGGGGNFKLSTSLVGYIPIHGAVSAMCHDGYGCFYGIENDNYRVAVTTYKNCPSTDTMSFYQNLSRSLIIMRSLLLQARL
ncbi:peroxisomal carnitine O-octanoyltransferase-like isoform X3 [Apostichopus japonicus]|uniref:peroxisomal carnitine O-octanoyltransferase-like isoform X3 n=1 Tax=Stichopus japonicus TaxID=307972 RepID=UPI003AB528B0